MRSIKPRLGKKSRHRKARLMQKQCQLVGFNANVWAQRPHHLDAGVPLSTGFHSNEGQALEKLRGGGTALMDDCLSAGDV